MLNNLIESIAKSMVSIGQKDIKIVQQGEEIKVHTKFIGYKLIWGFEDDGLVVLECK